MTREVVDVRCYINAMLNHKMDGVTKCGVQLWNRGSRHTISVQSVGAYFELSS